MFFCENEPIVKIDLNLRPSLEQGCGKQTPSAGILFSRSYLVCVLNVEESRI